MSGAAQGAQAAHAHTVPNAAPCIASFRSPAHCQHSRSSRRGSATHSRASGRHIRFAHLQPAAPPSPTPTPTPTPSRPPQPTSFRDAPRRSSHREPSLVDHAKQAIWSWLGWGSATPSRPRTEIRQPPRLPGSGWPADARGASFRGSALASEPRKASRLPSGRDTGGSFRGPLTAEVRNVLRGKVGAGWETSSVSSQRKSDAKKSSRLGGWDAGSVQSQRGALPSSEAKRLASGGTAVWAAGSHPARSLPVSEPKKLSRMGPSGFWDAGSVASQRGTVAEPRKTGTWDSESLPSQRGPLPGSRAKALSTPGGAEARDAKGAALPRGALLGAAGTAGESATLRKPSSVPEGGRAARLGSARLGVGSASWLPRPKVQAHRPLLLPELRKPVRAGSSGSWVGGSLFAARGPSVAADPSRAARRSALSSYTSSLLASPPPPQPPGRTWSGRASEWAEPLASSRAGGARTSSGRASSLRAPPPPRASSGRVIGWDDASAQHSALASSSSASMGWTAHDRGKYCGTAGRRQGKSDACSARRLAPAAPAAPAAASAAGAPAVCAQAPPRWARLAPSEWTPPRRSSAATCGAERGGGASAGPAVGWAGAGAGARRGAPPPPLATASHPLSTLPHGALTVGALRPRCHAPSASAPRAAPAAPAGALRPCNAQQTAATAPPPPTRASGASGAARRPAGAGPAGRGRAAPAPPPADGAGAGRRAPQAAPCRAASTAASSTPCQPYRPRSPRRARPSWGIPAERVADAGTETDADADAKLPPRPPPRGPLARYCPGSTPNRLVRLF